jgi:hypothetical protein
LARFRTLEIEWPVGVSGGLFHMRALGFEKSRFSRDSARTRNVLLRYISEKYDRICLSAVLRGWTESTPFISLFLQWRRLRDPLRWLKNLGRLAGESPL